MNCDECKEQVLDLIEREAVDPEGVRGVLARCPECKAAFDEMKVTLALTDALPLEEPPAALDTPVLRAARVRATRVVPLNKRRLQPPPWAMAAVALLAVGVGVWTIPGEVRFEGEGDVPVQAPVEEAVAKQTYADQKSDGQEALREQTVADDEDAFAGRAMVAGGSATMNAPAPALERAEPERKKGAKRARRAQRRLPPSSSELGAAAPAAVAAADMRVAGAEESASEAQTAKAAVPQKKKELAEDGEVGPTCKQRVDELERRARAEEDYARTPEEELAIGRCYLKLRNPAAARTWLERAAVHRETRVRAESALRALADE